MYVVEDFYTNETLSKERRGTRVTEQKLLKQILFLLNLSEGKNRLFTFKVTVQFERCFRLMEHISDIS